MTKRKSKNLVLPKVWREHLQRIASSRTARKAEACRDNLAKAREVKQLKKLGLWPPQEQNEEDER